MEKRLLQLFQHEIERQCQFALIAVEDMHQFLNSQERDRLWYSVQAFLVAVGNVSKLLWPSSESKECRKELRKSLSIKEDSPIRPRTFRNHFEHFDERLEEWATSSKHKSFIDTNVVPTNIIHGVDPSDYIRNFDPTKFAVTFRGDTYELKPIVDVVKQLHTKAAIESRRQ